MDKPWTGWWVVTLISAISHRLDRGCTKKRHFPARYARHFFASFHSASISSRLDCAGDLPRSRERSSTSSNRARSAASHRRARSRRRRRACERGSRTRTRGRRARRASRAASPLVAASRPRATSSSTFANEPSQPGQSKPTLPQRLPIFCARTSAGPGGMPSSDALARLALRRLLGRLDLVPLREHLVRGVDARRVAEHVRVAADELVGDAGDDGVDVERALGAAQRGVKHDLHQQVAQLLAVAGDVAARRARRGPRRSPRRGRAGASRASARGPTGSRRARAGGP